MSRYPQTKRNRNIFIDCGAHCGCSRRMFRSKMDPDREYEIFSFEPDPEFNKFCPQLINKAVWVKNTEKTYYKFELRGGSSIIKGRENFLKQKKGYHNIEKKILIQCFDIDQWIRSHFKESDNIILKLDIECAEYKVLIHMMDNGSFDYINELHIEWHHPRKCGGDKKFFDSVKKRVQSYNKPILNWNAIKKEYCVLKGWKKKNQ